jgi:hypothetical protein
VGNGYAYSENFIDPQDALEEFKNYLLKSKNHNLTKNQIDELPFFEIKMKTGFYETAMVKNVVGIGMSSGFLEPLEGTGLHFIIESIYSLIKIIENGKPNQFLIDSFNLRVNELYRSWVDTLSFIYLSSKKDDTDYWKHISKLSFVNLDFTSKNNFHDTNDFAYRLHYWTRHHYENDLFNNVVRGSGLINNFNQMDADMFSMNQRKNGTTSEELYKKYYDIMVKNLQSPYHAGERNKAWIKWKRIHKTSHLKDTIDAVVLGYYYGKGKRAQNGIGALLIGLFEEKKNFVF